MSFTYSGDPAGTPLDTVRFLIGDTIEARSLLADEEIDWLLATYTTTQQVAIEGVKAMLAKIASDTLVSADGITRDLSGRRQSLENRLAELRRSSALLATPFVGGASIAEREARQRDTDLVQPAFRRGQFDEDT